MQRQPVVVEQASRYKLPHLDEKKAVKMTAFLLVKSTPHRLNS
ncbi:hypothetical protein SOHN41_02870 [Shewanella sp. HN-41]|nr:hypothetical protein SOHN41_02870 [Shewanella sp. HN-41]